MWLLFDISRFAINVSLDLGSRLFRIQRRRGLRCRRLCIRRHLLRFSPCLGCLALRCRRNHRRTVVLWVRIRDSSTVSLWGMPNERHEKAASQKDGAHDFPLGRRFMLFTMQLICIPLRTSLSTLCFNGLLFIPELASESQEWKKPG